MTCASPGPRDAMAETISGWFACANCISPGICPDAAVSTAAEGAAPALYDGPSAEPAMSSAWKPAAPGAAPLLSMGQSAAVVFPEPDIPAGNSLSLSPRVPPHAGSVGNASDAGQPAYSQDVSEGSRGAAGAACPGGTTVAEETPVTAAAAPKPPDRPVCGGAQGCCCTCCCATSSRVSSGPVLDAAPEAGSEGSALPGRLCAASGAQHDRSWMPSLVPAISREGSAAALRGEPAEEPCPADRRGDRAGFEASGRTGPS